MAIVVTAALDVCGKNATRSSLSPVAIQPQFDGFLTAFDLATEIQLIDNTVVSCEALKRGKLADPLLSCLQPSQRP
jgi:hypothetical protein